MGDAAAAGCNLRRVARPESYRYFPSGKERAETWSRLLSKINSCYTEACERLAVRARPVTLARFLDAGVCIGLLDPVSNIIANTVLTSHRWPDRREKVLVDTLVDEKVAEMGQRSLHGLVAFLLYFFPYLAHWEATRYLLLAEADLLAAARFVVADRGMTVSLTSPASSVAFEAALALAAQVAEHPRPKQLVHVWVLLSSRLLHQALPLLSEVRCHSPLKELERLETVLDDPVVPCLDMSWDLAASRLRCSNSITNMPYQHTRSLRLVLLDTIHGFYLQALAKLPTGELQSHLHRSLLRAGYCYGPLDPVSNIIHNTIWYHANFPAAVTPVLEVIGPKSLTRLESRSFYGLVSFLQTRYHDLSEHEAVRCLIATCGQLSIADPKLISATQEEEVERHCSDSPPRSRHCVCSLYDDVLRKVEEQSPCADIQEAYMAAATAAWHPNPKEQAAFLSSWKGRPIESQVTSRDLRLLSDLLSPKQLPTPERICKSSYPVRVGKMRSMAQQERISRKVQAALGTHLLENGIPAFDLHIISCVNEYVCGPEFCGDIGDPVCCPLQVPLHSCQFLGHSEWFPVECFESNTLLC